MGTETAGAQVQTRVEGAPEDFPEDAEGRHYYMVADILLDKAAGLRKGDGEQLKALTNFLIRAIYNGHAPQLQSLSSCPTCSQCLINREKCLNSGKPYAYCMQQYSDCLDCPCNPG